MYSYDGFLITGTTWTGDVSGNVTQVFNNDFRVLSRSINNSNTVNFGYDNDSLLIQAGALTINREVQKGGLITGTTLGDVTTAHSYNSFGELANFDVNYDTTDLYEVTYTRDKIGRITERVETIQEITATEVYVYDQAGRLETVVRNGISTTYGYDSNGNRLSKIQGTTIENGIYDNQDRLSRYAGNTYSYSANGELKSKANLSNDDITTYNYDVLGNLISAVIARGTLQPQTIEYVIDGSNRRIGKKVNGVMQQKFLYADQLNPVAELDGDSQIISRFVYATKTNVPDYMIKDNITYQIISDHLGSPRLVVNANTAEVMQRMDYDEFGNVIENTNPGFQPFGFAGGLYDNQTKLTRFGARDYDAHVGRWTSKDPIRFFANDMNFYEYVSTDPVNAYDVLGLAQVCKRPLGSSCSMPGSFYHSQIQYNDSSDSGFFPDGVRSDKPSQKKKLQCEGQQFDDATMKEAEKNVQDAGSYDAADYNFFFNNCQDYTNDVINEYGRLLPKP